MASFSDNRVFAQLLNLYLTLRSLDNLFFNVDSLSIQVLDHFKARRLKWIANVIFEKVNHCNFGETLNLVSLN
jgi:hypothetical protein